MDKERAIIYAVMVCTKFEEEVYPTGKRSGFPDYGESRVVGFYTDYADAQKAVKNNVCDIHETSYDFACIEKVKEGIYSPGMLMEWYKYNPDKDEYEPIETPDFDKHTCGRTIG